jgi:hypothetical protein
MTSEYHKNFFVVGDTRDSTSLRTDPNDGSDKAQELVINSATKARHFAGGLQLYKLRKN